jgi:hypothetical protein
MGRSKDPSVHERWAHLRFSVIGQLLAAPPPRGELRVELKRLAARTWQHPITGEPVHFALSTIERWLLRSRIGVAAAAQCGSGFAQCLTTDKSRERCRRHPDGPAGNSRRAEIETAFPVNSVVAREPRSIANLQTGSPSVHPAAFTSSILYTHFYINTQANRALVRRLHVRMPIVLEVRGRRPASATNTGRTPDQSHLLRR